MSRPSSEPLPAVAAPVPASPRPAAAPAVKPAAVVASPAASPAAKPAAAAPTKPTVPADATASATAAAEPPAPPSPAAPARKTAGWRYSRFLRARIGTDQLRLELFSSRRKPQLLAQVVQAYVAGDDSGTTELPTELAAAAAALGPALDALEARVVAEGAKSIRGLVCDVVIDDAWMLYDVVRADLRGLSPRAADALIGASLADVAGVAPSEIVSRWQPQGESPYTLACGLPANALPVVGETLRAHRVATGAVEGEFVLEYNRHRLTLEPKCSVIAVVREAGAQLAVLINGVLTTMSFEFGVGAPKELELRGRGLLRVAGVGGDGSVNFYAISSPGWKAPEPWVCLPAAA